MCQWMFKAIIYYSYNLLRTVFLQVSTIPNPVRIVRVVRVSRLGIGRSQETMWL